ncbi:MAG: ferritin-like domain-containing protein [Chloroflexota bacterium]|nr:ferritin-like domain-containing protein [Chloroflexota bacterium]
MPLQTPRDLFVHELSDTLSAEHIVLKMLGDLQSESRNDDVKAAYKHHQQETEAQVRNLDKVFAQLGEKPEQTTCFAAEGLKKEHAALKEEGPSPMVQEMGNLGGAAKTEHYEIASYTTLVQMARDLGEKEAVELLNENLAQEKEMARTVESLAKQLGKEAKAQTKEMETAKA